MIQPTALNKLVKTSVLLASSLFALGLPGKANSADTVINGKTDLTAPTTYTGGVAPGTSSDVEFTPATTYSPATFTVAGGTGISIGTLDDLSTTALTINSGTVAGANTITLNGGQNSIAPDPADLLYVAASGNLTIANGTNSGTLGVVLGTSGNFDIVGGATINSVISGASGFTKTGAGTLAVGGSNTYTGATAVNAGVLQFNGGGSILHSAVTVGAGGKILFVSNNNESAFVAGGIAGQGGIEFNYNNPSSVYTLNEANTYTGTTTFLSRGVVNAGVATVYSGGVAVSGAFGVNSALTFVGTGGETVILKGYSQQVGSLVGGVAGNGIVLNGANLTIGGDNADATFGGQITGGLIPFGATGTHYDGLGSGANIGGNLIKIGTGTQSLTSPNLYTGSTMIDGGTLSISSIANGGIATTLTSTAASGATTLNVASTAGVVVGQNIVGSGGLQNQTVSAVSGNTVTLSSAIPDQAVNNGTAVYFGTGNGLGISTNAASNLVLDGGTLRYTGAAASTDRLFTVGSTEAGGATGTLDASGTGALAFSNMGAIAYGTADQARTLGLTGTNVGANTLALLIADNGVGQVNVLKSGAGSWTLTNADTYTGTTTISDGTLQVGDGTSGSISSSTAITDDGTLAFDEASGNTQAVSNAITGTGAVTQSGAGSTVTLSAANTYTGGTTISAGSVNATNTTGSATGTGTVNLGAATLTGTGIITGLVNATGAASASTITAATIGSIGTFTLSGGITAGDGLTMNFAIDGTGATNSQVALGAGNFDITGSALVFNLYDLGTNSLVAGTAYTIMTGTGTSTLPTSVIANLIGSNYTLDTSYGNNGILISGDTVTFEVAVPEPSTWAMLLGGVVLLVTIQRRRRAARF